MPRNVSTLVPSRKKRSQIKSKKLISPKGQNRKFLIQYLLLGFFFLFLAGAIAIYQNYNATFGISSFTENPKLQKEKISNSSLNTEIESKLTTEELTEKKQLIQSFKIDDVTKAIAIGFVPRAWTGSDIETNYDNFHLTSYGIDLSKAEFDKLNNLLNQAEQYGSTVAMSTVDNTEWSVYMGHQFSTIHTKNGYMCELTEPVGEPWNTEPSIVCVKIHYLKDNSLTNVKQFLHATFADAGITCNDTNCIVKQMNNEWPLYKYGRKILYRNKSVSLADSQLLIHEVKQEASKSAEFLRSSGWQTELQDYSDKEKSWDKSALISVLIRANNELFFCAHTITVDKLGLRQMIECAYKAEKLPEVQTYYDPY